MGKDSIEAKYGLIGLKGLSPKASSDEPSLLYEALSSLDLSSLTYFVDLDLLLEACDAPCSCLVAPPTPLVAVHTHCICPFR